MGQQPGSQKQWFEVAFSGKIRRKELSSISGVGEVHADPSSSNEQLRDALKMSEQGLVFQSTHDMLTGVWNRPAVLDILGSEAARSDRQGVSFALIMFAADNFKIINEVQGGGVGDEILRAMVRRIRRIIRPYDSIGRTSGNQFVVVAPLCDHKGAISMAERLRRSFAEGPTELANQCNETGFDDIPALQIPVTLSVGVFVSSKERNPEEMLRGARQAFYTAKQAGGNRVVMSTSSTIYENVDGDHSGSAVAKDSLVNG